MITKEKVLIEASNAGLRIDDKFKLKSTATVLSELIEYTQEMIIFYEDQMDPESVQLAKADLVFWQAVYQKHLKEKAPAEIIDMAEWKKENGR